VRADDLAADGEPRPESIRPRGEECIENAFEAIRGYTVAVVRGFASIQQQIEQHLLQLNAVADNFGQADPRRAWRLELPDAS
jgi:hypothetical protein